MKKVIEYFNIVVLLLLGFKGLSQQDPSSYKPIPTEDYIISAWVQEHHDAPQITYSSMVAVRFTDINGTAIPTDFEFTPTGNIIDGWQRITGEFKVPENAANILIDLVNLSAYVPDPNGGLQIGNVTYFDDIRVYPFNGNLKSFVYDPLNQRLIAELDENNFATIYDYDKEGGLVRVKKETEKGVFTIQETRSGNSKLNADN